MDEGVADSCRAACDLFEAEVRKVMQWRTHDLQGFSQAAFATARQLSAVYSLFGAEDLTTLLNGFVSQARAMSLLFAAAGGLIEAQDEALAGALSKAAEEPAGLQSLGLIHASESDVFALQDMCVMGAYGRVGPEDVSDSPLERIAQCAEELQPSQFSDIDERATRVSEALNSAAEQLNSDLNNILGSSWQGEFASSAQDSVTGLVNSALALSGELEQVAAKARRAHDGFVTTRTNVADQAAQAKIAQLSGREHGPAGLTAAAESRARMAAAEEQARAIVNTEYSPAVMDANLDDLDFTAAYRVVSTSALGGPNGVDMARIWNTEGIPRPAQPAAPNPAAIAAITGGESDEQAAGPGAVGAANGVNVGATTTSSPGAATDAATEQALLAARAGAADGGGSTPTSAGQAGAGGGVNATTTAAGAPFAPIPGAHGQQAGGGAGGAAGIRGIRGGTVGDNNRNRDRGFGSTAGLVGGGGAAAAGAGASRMGGAGTLAGFGAGGPSAGAPGAGSAGAGAAGPGAGAFSSSSPSAAHAGRAGAMPMGGVMGAAGAGQNNDRRGHTPASYLTNATNTTAIIGEPVKVAPAVLGRAPVEDATSAVRSDQPEPFRGRVIGRDYTGGGADRH
ncbi:MULTISPECIES: hypothetical protein [Dietzia]|uniref:PPE domain-containing protein n=1 Tax=Dietzia maris TaxID=37915 RepID=A0ABT8H3J6_9ACTN|nr:MULTISPECIES: hypothetical protein [Dietzia]MDJ0424060.1 hypothetical protein [Dietzia kunjamensis]MDN4507031.1 hypothetical protein [Dietzia maris]